MRISDWSSDVCSSDLYRVPVATRNGWEETEFSLDSHRQGIQSQVSFLALHSHPGRSSATLRGKALRQIFFFQDVPDPPANVTFALPANAANPKLPTQRHRLTALPHNPPSPPHRQTVL